MVMEKFTWSIEVFLYPASQLSANGSFAYHPTNKTLPKESECFSYTRQIQ